MRRIIPAAIVVLTLAYCDSGFVPDLADRGSANTDLVESLRLHYEDITEAGILPVAHKTLDDSIKAIVQAKLVKKYPPDWDKAVTWPSGLGTYYIATLRGTDKPMRAYSPDTLDLIRTLIAETDADGKIITSKIVDFSSLNPLDESLFQIYAKEWLDSHFGDKKIVTSEYSVGYGWEKSDLFNPADSTLTPQVVSFGKLDAIGKTKEGGEHCFFSHVEWGGTCWPDPDGEWVDSDGNSVSCSGIDEYHIYYCTNIDQDDGGGVDDPGDDDCPNGCDDVGGGTGDDDDDEEDEDTTPKFTLSCSTSVQRGSEGGCDVLVSGTNAEGEQYTAADFDFDWSSNLGASFTGSGNEGNVWRGTATSDITISVSVATHDYKASRDIPVTSRSVGSLAQLNAGHVRYTGRPRSEKGDNVYGFYRVPEPASGEVTQATGNGPWSGQAYTKIKLYATFYSELHVSHDYTSSGPAWPLANASCPGSDAFPFNSSYDYVNLYCNTFNAWISFGAEVEAHEWQHETSFNACLGSQTATDMLVAVEATTGSVAEVSQGIHDHWYNFWAVTFRDSGFADGPSTGPGFHLYAGGSWSRVPEYPGINPDGGNQSGC